MITISTTYATATAVAEANPDYDVVMTETTIEVHVGPIVLAARIPEPPLTQFAHGYLSRRSFVGRAS